MMLNRNKATIFKMILRKLLIPMVLPVSICLGQTGASGSDSGGIPASSLDSGGGSSPASTQSAPRPSIVQVPRITTVGQSALNPQSAPEKSTIQQFTDVKAELDKDASKVTVPFEAKSEFELFAEDAAGVPLMVYGRQLFNDVPTTFAPVDRVPVPNGYVVGPGDELVIRAWGKIEIDVTVTVDRNGQIYLPKVGTVSVAGLRFEQLGSYLHAAIGTIYTGFELNVTIGQLRSIQVFVLGSARRPGVYTVSSLSTLVNALFASGGPSATGSMRRIQLRRNDRLLTEFDIYDLLRRGDKSHDVQLLPGDVIYIPPVGPQVAIFGSVKEPGIYELKGESTIEASIEAAGGVTNLAEMDTVVLERIAHHRRRRVDQFALDEAGVRRNLQDGDLLQLFPISPKFENAITLRGNVMEPGRFPWHEGMRVTDLITSRNLLITRSHWKQQNHLPSAEHPDLMSELSELSAEINWDYASVERLDGNSLHTHVIAINLGNALDHPESADNIVMQPGDVLTVFSKADIPLPTNKHTAFVRLSGEVNAPGVYSIDPSETLRHVVERAGGLTPQSYLYASVLTRASARKVEEAEIQQAVKQMQMDLVSRYANSLSMPNSSTVSSANQLSAQQAMIANLASAKPTGRVVLYVKPNDSGIAGVPDFPLEDGDEYFVPARLNTVQVSGAVFNRNAFRYEPNKKLSSYLNDAGGATRQADMKRAFLIRADGSVVSRQGHSHLYGDDFMSMHVLPGDSIIIPMKITLPNAWLQALPTIAQFATSGALVGVAVR